MHPFDAVEVIPGDATHVARVRRAS